MKQSAQTDKYSIAWFKLAEYVSRGEKERALGIYKLLSHSLDDRAFAYQLEGDILWSFNDTGASDRYFQAAQLYKKDQRLLQAAALYEQLISAHPDSIEYLNHLIEVYVASDNKIKLQTYVPKLCSLLFKKNEHEQVSLLLQKIKYTESEFIVLHEQLFFAFADNVEIANNLKELHLYFILDGLLLDKDQKKLALFLKRLETAQNSYYNKACLYSNEK